MQKAQSAVEYLTTYSWAILIIAITLGALYALGLFNPGAFVNSECIFPADFGCLTGFLYSNGTLAVNLEQSTTAPINITAYGCNTAELPTNMTQLSGANVIYLQIGANVSFSVRCWANGTYYTSQPGSLYRGYLLVNYTNLQTGFQHISIAKLIEKTN